MPGTYPLVNLKNHQYDVILIYMANKKTNWGAWLLKFVGSLVYLYVIAQLWNPGTVSGTFGPILFGLAVVFSVSLFLSQLGALAMPSDDKMMAMWSMRAAFAGGFALLAATYSIAGGSMWLLVALIGFVIAHLGAAMDMK